MSKRMLIDAVHPEETRVVVLNGDRIEEFDYETTLKKQLKGNVYLAKVTRVEPSLQAAFVDYGGNRHGFLPFSEIHPSYYQIPVGDKGFPEEDKENSIAGLIGNEALSDEADDNQAVSQDDDDFEDSALEMYEDESNSDEELSDEDNDEIESFEFEQHKRSLMDKYRIQEVIKHRQILLVQVTKEERGSKGAALTTYVSLAGRYCVLMPNTPKSGGISRKIHNPQSRKKLRSIIDELNVPDSMSVIIRTAGMERSRTEIKRDFEYLSRLWENMRNKTLKSIAPSAIYEETELIKRSIRDVYNKDINEIQVEGHTGYRTAKDFMKLLVPSHAKKVQEYKDDLIPLFYKEGIEKQIDEIYHPHVKLKSGGELVISPTEALTAIDINSARATRERHIDETAFNTNMEAAEEIARQIKLRDLGGLIVIDFIDMQNDKHIQSVERKFRESLRGDRARLQIANISTFGLLELTRQRIRPSLTDLFTTSCSHCGGTGRIRSIESSSLRILRAIEDEGMKKKNTIFTIVVHSKLALYLLNQKRGDLNALESRYSVRVFIETDDHLVIPSYKLITSGETKQSTSRKRNTSKPDRQQKQRQQRRTKQRKPRSKQQRYQQQSVETQTAQNKAVEVDLSKVEQPDIAPPQSQTADRQDGNAEQMEDSSPQKKKRRGRRGGRGRTATQASGTVRKNTRGRKPKTQETTERTAPSESAKENIIRTDFQEKEAPKQPEGFKILIDTHKKKVLNQELSDLTPDMPLDITKSQETSSEIDENEPKKSWRKK